MCAAQKSLVPFPDVQAPLNHKSGNGRHNKRQYFISVSRPHCHSANWFPTVPWLDGWLGRWLANQGAACTCGIVLYVMACRFFFFFADGISRFPFDVPTGFPSRGGDVAVYVFNINQPSSPTPFLFCSYVCFCLYGPFNCISFHNFSRHLSAFSLCSSGLMSALLVLSTTYFFMKVSLSPDIILCG